MLDDAQFRDRAVYLSGADALVVADVHVGRDAASNVELPLGERADLRERLTALLDAFEPATLVLAGDVLHAFGELPDAVEASLGDLTAAARDRGVRPVAVRGNHDAMLDAAFDGPVEDAHRLADGTVVVHGHEAPGVEADRYVAGHDHPAIRVEGDKRPCWLYGPGVYRGADVLLVPAFNALTRGVVVNDMRGRDFDTPLVEAGAAGALRPLVRDETAGETLAFPPLGEFRELL